MTDFLNTAERYLYESAFDEKTNVESIVEEQLTYAECKDDNSKNYVNRMVQFDCSNLGTTNGQASLKEAILRAPLQIVVDSDQDLTQHYVNNLVNLKGNYTSTVDGLQIILDNQTIRNFNPHTEVTTYYNHISTITEDYKKVAGGIDNTFLDDGELVYGGEATGETMKNNTAINKKSAHMPLLETNDFRTTDNLSRISKPHCIKNSAKRYTYNFMCEIQLKELDSIFRDLELTQGMYLKMNIQFHVGSCEFKSTAGVISDFSAKSSYGVLPFYINPDALNDIKPAVAAVAGQLTTAPITLPVAAVAGRYGLLKNSGVGTIKMECAILKTELGGIENSIQGFCSLHVPMYKFRGPEQAKLVSRRKVNIQFNEPIYHIHRHAPPGAFESKIATSGSRYTYLLIHVRLADKVNFGADAIANATNGYSTMLSPFSSSPFTTKRHASLSDLQIRLGGNQLFTKGKIINNYDSYTDLFRKFNSNKGSLDPEDCSGLLTREDFDNNYGYILVDLRKYKGHADWTSLNSLEIEAFNNSPNPVDIMYFLMQEKEFSIDVETGKVMQV